MYYNLLNTACINSVNIHGLCCKLGLFNYIDSVNIPSTFCWHFHYIFAHNFLNIQLIFNLIEVLESWKLGLFYCVNSVDITSTFLLITSLIFNWFSIWLKFWKAASTCIALNILYFVQNVRTGINSVDIYRLSFPELQLNWKLVEY